MSNNLKEIDKIENLDIPKNQSKTSKRLIGILYEQKGKFYLVIGVSIIYTLLQISFPLLMAWGINNLISTISKFKSDVDVSSILNSIKLPVISIGFIAIACAIFSWIQEYTMASVSEMLTLTLRKKVSEKLTKVPMNYFDNNKVGDILTRVTLDLDKVAEVMQVGLMQFINAIIKIVTVVSIMLYISPILTIGVLAILLISTIFTNISSKKIQVYYAKNQAALGEFGTRVEEIFTGNDTIKAFNKQGDFIKEIRQLNKNYYNTSRKAEFVGYAIKPIIGIMTKLGFVISAVFGAMSVLNGTMSIGIVQAYLQYINQISEPINQSSYIINSLQSAIAATERVFEIIDAKEEVCDKDYLSVEEKINPKISFSNVEFGYNKDKIIMKDVSFDVFPKQTVAIVGPTGAGKTTLINLLMKFYDLNSGKISIDGVDIAIIKRGDLRRNFGMVLQDTWLFEGTIADNISYGKKDATREEVIKAAKDAKCHHFITTLPNGYDTIISSDNSIISQGQQQLLTIARIMLLNPSILILDEATSSVDTKTELEIKKAMENLSKDKTSFVIAHRLSTIKNADVILVMKDGNIIEKGSHDELLSKETFYKDLYVSQFAIS